MGNVIAIDGPAGSGKSTVARAVAAAVGLPMLETGAMYRALTWAVLQAGADPADGEAVTGIARRADIQADMPGGPGERPHGTVRVDGTDVSEAVRSAEVTAHVSTVAAHPGAREVLVEAQRAWLRAHGGGVAEGRDIGSVVAPDATLKVYLVASAETRAERRVAQEGEETGGLEATLADIRRRDGLDSGRAASPLVIPEDAVVIDTTGRSVEQVVDEVVEHYRKVVPAPAAAPAAPEPKPAPAHRPAPALPSPPGRGELIFYGFSRAVVVGLSKALWRLTVVHRERLPRSGAYVLAPSHRSILDTPFLGGVTRRRIRFMGKAELWRKGGPARLLSALGGFPVERGVADRSALRSAVAAVEGGEPLAVFPEGTRRHGPLIEDLHDGVAYVAAKVGVPIVPVGIGGSEGILAKGRKIPRFKKVVLVVGEPLEPPARSGSVKRSDVAALTEKLQHDLQLLFDEAQGLAGA